MFKKDKDEIDAGNEIEAAEAEREELEEDRSPEDLGGRRRVKRGGKGFLLLSIPIVAVVAGIVSYKAIQYQSSNSEDDSTLGENMRNSIPEMSSPPPAPEPEPAEERVTVNGIDPIPQQQSPVVEAPPPQQQESYQSVDEARASSNNGNPVRERRFSSALIAGGASSRSSGSGADGSQGGEDGGRDVDPNAAGYLGGNGGNDSELSERLQPTKLEGGRASVLRNRDMLITRGTMVDCVLDTRIVSTQPGMLACHTTRDIYSTNGRVVLLERGSKVVGEYQGGLQQGQGRIFALWTRVETPEGVVINLDSPGTGPLGEGGLDGHINTHFATRFGGAILISMIGDVGTWLSNQGSGSNNIQFNQTSDGAQQAAVEALKNSVNIPPTLTKNQGERVGIYVARDLDFSDVYELRRK